MVEAYSTSVKLSTFCQLQGYKPRPICYYSQKERQNDKSHQSRRHSKATEPNATRQLRTRPCLDLIIELELHRKQKSGHRSGQASFLPISDRAYDRSKNIFQNEILWPTLWP